MRLVLVVFAVLLIVSLLPAWPHSANWGYFPSGGVLLLTVLAVVLLVSGRKGRGIV